MQPSLSVTWRFKLSNRDNICLIQKFSNLYLRNNNPQKNYIVARTNNVKFLELNLNVLSQRICYTKINTNVRLRISHRLRKILVW